MDKTQLSETAINGLRSTKDYVKFCDSTGMRPEKICINKNSLSSARKAYSLYNARIEEGKREKAEKLKKEQAVLDEKLKAERLLYAKKMATLEEKERNLEAEKAVMQKISVINQLLCEGHSKLANALRKNDITNAKVAQIMIDTAAKDSGKNSDELKAIQRDQRAVCEKQQNIRKQNHDGLSGEPPSKMRK